MTAPYLSVVIPAYNESRRLPRTLSQCLAFLNAWDHTWEIVVVDDGSQDDTAAIVQEVSRTDPRVRLVRGHHGGKGSAVRLGMLEAHGAWRFFADADLSMDLDELPKFFATPADVAVASREAPGAQRIGEPFLRHVIGRVFNWCVRLIVVRGIRDTQCGYKLFSESAARHLFTTSRLNGFAFDVELLFLARKAGLRVREVPVTWRHQPGSRVRAANGLNAFLQLLTIRRNSLRGVYDAPYAGASTVPTEAAPAAASKGSRD